LLVWAALTTGKAMDGWWGTTGSAIDLRPGGKLTMRWRDWGPERDTNVDAECVVVEVHPPTRFVYKWGETPSTMTTVEFDLEERDGATLLRLREHGFANTREGPVIVRRQFARLGGGGDARQVLCRAWRQLLITTVLSFEPARLIQPGIDAPMPRGTMARLCRAPGRIST
jgi:uncharacterized protein YndB with AHSA1/START domain